MTIHETIQARPAEAWRSSLDLWSTLAQAPARVAAAQARLTLRLMQAAAPWPTPVRASEDGRPVPEDLAPEAGAMTAAAAEALPEVPKAGEPAEAGAAVSGSDSALADPAVESLVVAAVAPLRAEPKEPAAKPRPSRARASSGRARKPRKG